MKNTEAARVQRKVAVLRACALTILVAVQAGCRDEFAESATSPAQQAAPPARTQEAAPGVQGRPQPRLPTIKLFVGTNELTTEVAATRRQIEMGMMWRTNMAEMEAMLFVFGRPHRAQFWMRNTLLSLSCAYIDREGTILELHDMKPLDESPIPAGSDQVQYVLEVNQGWFQRHNVQPGMLITTERGAFAETFFNRR